MNKPFIKALSIWNNISSNVLIDCGDGTTVKIETPPETLEGMELDQKFAYLKGHAEKYMKCIEASNEPANMEQ